MAPNAYRSARASIFGLAAACSGAMYAGVPRAMPSDVVDDAVGSFDADNAFATPKVGDHRAAARQQNVVGFDVAVDDALFVGVIERRRDLAKQAQTFDDGQLSALRQPLPQRLSFDQRHREERQRRRAFVIAPDLTRAQQRLTAAVYEYLGALVSLDYALGNPPGQMLGPTDSTPAAPDHK